MGGLFSDIANNIDNAFPAFNAYGVGIDGTGALQSIREKKSTYQLEVLGCLNQIHNTRTGQFVFSEFTKRTRHAMKITPYSAAPLNAFAQPSDLQGATPKGEVERSGKDGSQLKDSKGNAIIGTGTGSDAVVHFTPKIFAAYCSQNTSHKCGAQPDEILFHEMIHGMRDMLGILDPIPLGFLYDTEEEFFAILLANIYASETGRAIDIRSDHHGFEHLATDTDAKFLPKKDITDYRYRLIDKFVHQEAALARELSQIKCDFNPFRQYFRLQLTFIASAPFTSMIHPSPLNTFSVHQPVRP